MMSKVQQKLKFIVIGSILYSLFTGAVYGEATGNRYNLPRDYKSEVSSAQAYILTNKEHEEGHGKSSDPYEDRKVIIIDVRTVEEYVAGHPRKAYNIPYPHIQGRPNRTEPPYIGQNPKDFFDFVNMTFPNRDTPILTLCRTGYRSVLAANILANPSKWIPEYEGMDIEGYTNVRNIWEGFVGNYKTFTDPNDGITYELDVNNDGAITDADRDGWSNYQGLPFSTKLSQKRLYTPYIDLYYQN